MTIDAEGRGTRAGAPASHPSAAWTAIAGWAKDLVERIALDQTSQHIAVFVPDDDGAGLRLAAQVWGAGEDTGAVVVGNWTVPLEGSITGRVYRTGLAALCADIDMDPDYRAFPGGRSRSSLTLPVGPVDDVVAVINLEAPWVAAFSIRDYERMTAEAATAYATFPAAPLG